jgi:hypothetical protein
MNIAKLKNVPFHFLLFPLFFVWHVWNAYFGLIPFRYSLRYLLYYTGLAVVLFIIGKLFFRNNIKAGIWSTLLLIPFFFWGAMHDFLRKTSLPSFFSSYSFLLSFLLAIGTFIFIWLRKNKKTFVTINTFANSLTVMFIILELCISIYKQLSGEESKNHIAHYNTPVDVNIKNIHDTLKPDIYFIVFDEYASSSSLKKYYQFDNNYLDSILLKNDFFIANKSKSNYNSTPHSISSTLNLNYINIPLEKEKTVPLVMLKAQQFLKESILPKVLEENNYTIINNGLCDLLNHPAPTETFFNQNIPNAFTRETLWGRVSKEILWKITLKLPKKWFLSTAINTQKKETNISKENFNRLCNELNQQGLKPKFVFAHFMMPHAPYYFDKKGNLRLPQENDYSTNNRNAYTEQLEYVNTWIQKLAQKSAIPTSRPKVIIIEPDHGARNFGRDYKNFIREKQFMNLNSYYFSDGDYSNLYDSISPVNSFRVILNKYFNSNLPLLKDSTIFLY